MLPDPLPSVALVNAGRGDDIDGRVLHSMPIDRHKTMLDRA